MPAFAYWPGTVPPHSHSSEVISTMDVLPSLLKLAGLTTVSRSQATERGENESESNDDGAGIIEARRGVVLDGRDSLADIILGTGGSKHTFLPFYNGYFGNASTEIFAARAGRLVRRSCFATRALPACSKSAVPGVPLSARVCLVLLTCGGRTPLGIFVVVVVVVGHSRYKAHWVTAPGLGGGRWPSDAHAAPEKFYHDPPLVFDVEADPSETFPLQQAQVHAS